MNKIQISCEYDDYLVVSAEDERSVDALAAEIEKRNIDLDSIVEMVVPELTKLSPQGTAHAKTVYSAVNMLYRCPPGPVFYSLISNRAFQDTGSGYFALA